MGDAGGLKECPLKLDHLVDHLFDDDVPFEEFWRSAPDQRSSPNSMASPWTNSTWNGHCDAGLSRLLLQVCRCPFGKKTALVHGLKPILN